LNILHLHTNLNLTCGISKTIYLIAKYPSEKYKHFIVTLYGDAGKKFSDSNISVNFLNLKRDSVIGVFNIIKILKEYINENNIDVLHSHHRFFDFISYVLSFFCKIKRVTSVHSFVYGKKLISYKSPLLLAAGESVKKHLLNYFNIQEERIKILNSFIDICEINENTNIQSIKSNLNISSDAYLIGYVGRFSIDEKGIDILLNAFKIFNEKHSDSFLVMVGSGEDIKKIDVPKNVKIVLAKENIFDYYKIFNCLILPSRIDPFPLTALEAGMVKIPFIGADVNGISEIIEDNIDGLLFEKGNVNMLVDKMEIFYKDKTFAKNCSVNFYEKVFIKYNCKNAVELLNNIYEKL
jgi:L-malate glycosyltransferase